MVISVIKKGTTYRIPSPLGGSMEIPEDEVMAGVLNGTLRIAKEGETALTRFREQLNDQIELDQHEND